MTILILLIILVVSLGTGTSHRAAAFKHAHNVVYVSKSNGSTSLSCGSVCLPCKSLQQGFDVLAPRGIIYIDGKGSELDPYSCQSSGGKLLVRKNFTMKRYQGTPHISCTGGIKIRSSHDSQTMITMVGILLNKTMIRLENASAMFENCIFKGGEPSINIKQSDFPLTLNVKKSLFRNNNGCVKIDIDKKGNENVNVSLRDVTFVDNTILPSFQQNRGLVQVWTRVNTSQDYHTLQQTMVNVTILNNKVLLSKNNAIPNSKCMRNSTCAVGSFLTSNLHRVNLHLMKINSTGNVDMRFLHFTSMHCRVTINTSTFNGHNVTTTGGVINIKSYSGGISAKLFVYNSIFTNNVAADSGGVLYINGGNKKDVCLFLINTRIKRSYGLKTGCAICIGRVTSRSRFSPIKKLYVFIDKLLFQHCNAPCDDIQCKIEHRFGSFCMMSSGSSQVTIRRSILSDNINVYEPTIIIRQTATSGGKFHVKIQDTRFMRNAVLNVKGRKAAILHLEGGSMSHSSLNIWSVTFSENSGTVIKAKQINSDISLANVVCNNNKGLCLQIESKANNKSHRYVNPSTIIQNCSFENNSAGSLLISHKDVLHVDIRIQKSSFRNNVLETKQSNRIRIEFHRKNTQVSGNINIEEVEFIGNTINCSTGSVFGIAVFNHQGQFNATVRKCIFKDNYQTKKFNERHYVSDLVYLYLPHALLQNRSSTCHWRRRYRHRQQPYFPEFINRNNVMFEDVIFNNNTGYSNIIYIDNGKVTFLRCLFEDNFSRHPRTSALIFIEQGSPTITFESSVFIQTKVKSFPQRQLNDSLPQVVNTVPFLYYAGLGPFIIRNSSFTLNASEITTPMFIIQNARFVHFDEKTNFQCPVGSYVKLDNSSHAIEPEFTYNHCLLNITRLKFTCTRCPVGQYSLQRGTLTGPKLRKVWIECISCPFGGNCIKNVISRDSFWGYVNGNITVPQLKFEHCPESYCLSPRSTNPAVFNQCNGNRVGVMCGSCKKGFTESIFNHKCRLSEDCSDRWFWAVAGVYSIIMALYIMYQPPIFYCLIKKVLWFRSHTSDAVPNSRVGQLKQLYSHSDHGYSKIIFYFYQIAELIMLESCTEILRKEKFIYILISFYSFHAEIVDESMGCPFPGLNAVTKELFRSLQVFVVMAWIIVFYIISMTIHLLSKRPRPLVAPYIAAIVEVLLLGYERLGHTSLQLLSCTPLTINGHTEWRLFLDGNIKCWVHWWQFTLVAYNIIFVLPFLVVLLVGTSKLRRNEISPWVFVLACFFPLPFLVYWAIKRLLKLKPAKHVESSSYQLKFQLTFCLLHVLQGPFRTFNFPGNRSNGALHWESVLIGRRLVLLCLRAFIASPMPRLLCMTVVCIAILVHNVITLPYKEKRANRLSIATLFILVTIATINLSKASLIAVGMNPKGRLKSFVDALQTFEIVLLGILPFAVGILVLAVMVSQTVRLVLYLYLKAHNKWKNGDRVSLNSDYGEPLLDDYNEHLIGSDD